MARLLSTCLCLGVVAWWSSGLAWLTGLHATHKRQVRVAMGGGKTAKEGVFSPVVEGVKAALGQKELNSVRGEAIKAHGAVIAKMVETSDSPVGRMVLKRLFEAADADGSGTVDKEEIKACLTSLGFEWFEQGSKVDGVMKKADSDGDEVIDFEEFCEIAPTVLRQNLVKLAKKNGNDLGFLV